MLHPCPCDDPAQCCPVHHPPPASITVEAVLAGCDCAMTDAFGAVLILRSVLCPVHGAPAWRRTTP